MADERSTIELTPSFLNDVSQLGSDPVEIGPEFQNGFQQLDNVVELVPVFINDLPPIPE